MKHYIALITVFLVLCISIPVLTVWGVSRGKEKIVLPEKISVYITGENSIEILSYRDYIIGCVFGTIPPDSEKEAIKSAACACSTLAVYQLENCDRANTFGADVSDSPEEFQPYIKPEQLQTEYGQSYPRYLARVEECVDEALGYVITCNEKPIFPAMCSISAGTTDSAEEIFGEPLPYLLPVSAACDSESPDYISTATLSPEYVRRALSKYAEGVILPQNTEEWFTEPEYLPSGTLAGIKYGTAALSGAQLREALSLRSAAISVEFTEGMLKFTVKGCGNNVGMSIYCANQMALQGEKMTDILQYFYNGAELSPVSDV
ncbi:MAG: SpoIID/LytB domain-containing protein [Oscillospiraceae bacterium]